MILQLDVGNSAVKWRLRQDGSNLQQGSFEPGAALPDLKQSPDAVWVSSVTDPEQELVLADLLQERWGVAPWFARSGASACGVTSSYQDPSRMGVDRWLAMIAGFRLIGGPVCVIDAGSALTIDFLDGSGHHRGGYILPGMAMMERALLGETARVRFGDAPRDVIEPGRSTETAVFNGLQLAQVGAVTAALQRYGAGAELVFSGGNGEILAQLLAMGGNFQAELVLDGLELLAAEPAPTGVASA